MKKIFLIMLICLLMSCTFGTETDSNGNHFDVTTYDGCEYLRYPTYATYGYAHKGNCKNPIHIYNENTRNVSNPNDVETIHKNMIEEIRKVEPNQRCPECTRDEVGAIIDKYEEKLNRR